MRLQYAKKIKSIKTVACGASLVEVLIASMISMIIMSLLFEMYLSYQRNRQSQSEVFELIDHAILASDLLIEQISKDKTAVHRFYVDKPTSALYFIDDHHYHIRVVDGVSHMEIRYVGELNHAKGVDITLLLQSGKLIKHWYTYVAF